MKKTRILVTICLVLFAVLAAGILLWQADGATAYEQLRQDGYLGTEEELLACLVGELCGDTSAYHMACGLGYRGSPEQWAKTLTGRAPRDADLPVFRQMRDHGYEGALALWLESLVPHPEQLGRSDQEEATEYELACQYGFEGTFAQWLISLVGYEEN